MPFHLLRLEGLGPSCPEEGKSKHLLKGQQTGEMGLALSLTQELAGSTEVSLHNDQVVISKYVIKLLNLATITTANKVLVHSITAAIIVWRND